MPGEIEARAAAERGEKGIPVTLPVLRELEAIGEKAGVGRLV